MLATDSRIVGGTASPVSTEFPSVLGPRRDRFGDGTAGHEPGLSTAQHETNKTEVRAPLASRLEASKVAYPNPPPLLCPRRCWGRRLHGKERFLVATRLQSRECAYNGARRRHPNGRICRLPCPRIGADMSSSGQVLGGEILSSRSFRSCSRCWLRAGSGRTSAETFSFETVTSLRWGTDDTITVGSMSGGLSEVSVATGVVTPA